MGDLGTLITEIFSLAGSSKSIKERKALYSHHFTDGWATFKWREREENEQRLGIWNKQSEFGAY